MAENIPTIDKQFNNSGINNTAYSYQPEPASALPDNSVFPDWVNEIKTSNISKDIAPEINSIVNDMRYNASDLLQNKGKNGVDTLMGEMFPQSNKIQASYDVSINDTHEMLSDGETWIPKYENYLPGADNESRNASMQSNWEKFFNPIQKAGIKVGRGIFADIGSFVYGIGEAAITGRAESIFDNGMANYIDDLDKKTDFAFKNYYNESQNGLGANLYTWDKVLGGAEFTARMLGAEAIIAIGTGGASLPASFARSGFRNALNIAKTAERLEDVVEIGANASKISKIIKEPIAKVASQGEAIISAEATANAVQAGIRAGKTADYLKQGRFAVTGSMYEAGFEARHYQNDAEKAFWDYHREKGTEPDQKQISDFYSKLDNTSWGVFGANMAILSTSNLVLFGNMLNIKNPFNKLADGSFLNKSVFRIGTEKTADGTFKAMKSGFFNKALAYASPVAKGVLTEGVFEEGGQGIASNMMKNYIASTYDPKAMKETSDYVSSFSKAFKDQFSTKEGIEEIVIGGIIGGLFGGVHGASSVRNEYRNQPFVAQVQNAMPQVADSIVSNLYTNENLANMLGHSNRLQNINRKQALSQSNGDMIGDALASAESFVSMMQASSSVGKTNEFTDMLKASLQGMDNAQIAEGQNIRLEDVDAFKAEKIASVERLSEEYSKARELGGYLFGRGNIGGFYEVDGKRVNRQNLIDGFAYASAMSSVSQQLAGDSFNAFQQKLAEVGTDRNIIEQFGSIAALQSAGTLEASKFTQAERDNKRILNEQKKVQDEILRLQTGETTPEKTIKLQELAEKLIELGSEMTTTSQRRDLYWKSISDNFYEKLGTKGYLPQVDFNNFNDKVTDLKEVLGSTSLSEYDRFELNKILEEYDKSSTIFKSFSNLTTSMADPKFTYNVYNNIFSGIRAKKDQSLNDLTKQTFFNLYNTQNKTNDTITNFQPIPSPITEEVLKEINDNVEYVVSEEVVNYVTDKVRKKTVLSENDKVVYNKYKTVIDQAVTQTISDPINATTPETQINPLKVQILTKQKEIKELKKGEITDTIKAEIDKINTEIEKLKNKTTETSTDQSKIEEVKRQLGNIGNQKLFDDFIKLLSKARDNMSQTDLDILSDNLKNDSVAIVGGTTDNLRNNTERGDLDSAWIENPNSLEGEYFQEFETALSKLFSWITSDNNTRQQPETASGITKDRLNDNTPGNHSNPIYIGNIVLSILGNKKNTNIESTGNDSEKINQLEESKQDIINGRIENLENEIYDLKTTVNSQERLEQKKSKLSEKISILRGEIQRENILDSEINQNTKVRRLRNYEKQLKQLNEIREDFNPEASYYDQLQWVLTNSDIIQYENIEDLLSVQQPSQEDIDRYSELDAKPRKNKQDKQEISELREKLLPYRIAENSEFGGVPLLDIIALYNQLKTFDNIQNNQTLQLPESEVQDAIKKVQDQEFSPEFRASNVGLAYDGTYMRGGGGVQKLSHIKLSTILDAGIKINFPISLQEFKVENDNIIYGDSIDVTSANVQDVSQTYDNFGGVRIMIGDNIVVEKSENGTSFSVSGDITNLLGVAPYAITGQPNSYNLLYEQKADGTLAPKDSEFEVTRNGVVFPFNKEVLNKLEGGDDVTLMFDINDDYNKTLDKKDHVKKGNIYVLKNGELVNIMKATPNQVSENSGWAELNDLRKQVVENGSQTIKLKGSYMGLPIINLGTDGRAIENEINEDIVESYGYIDTDGNYTFFNANIQPDNSQYTDPYLENGKMIPIVAFKYNSKVYTFPIQIKPKGVNVQGELDAILNDSTMTEYQKIFQVNGLLGKYNLQSQELAWTTQNNTIPAIRVALSSVVENVDITDEDAFLEADKAIYLDMSDPFMSSKLIFDLKSAEQVLQEKPKTNSKAKVKPVSNKGKNLSDENKC